MSRFATFRRLASKFTVSDVLASLIAVGAGLAAGLVVYHYAAGPWMGLIMCCLLAMAGFFIGLVCMCLGRRERLTVGIVAVTSTVVPTALHFDIYPLQDAVGPLAVFFAIAWLVPVALLWFIRHVSKA
jgi:hypothetical protein